MVFMIQHIRESRRLSSTIDAPTTLLENNAACIAQTIGGYIKDDMIKHISPKFFCTHELQKRDNVDIRKIRSKNNLADIADIDIQEVGT